MIEPWKVVENLQNSQRALNGMTLCLVCANSALTKALAVLTGETASYVIGEDQKAMISYMHEYGAALAEFIKYSEEFQKLSSEAKGW